MNNLTRLDRTSGEVTDKIVNPPGFGNLAVDPTSGIWGIGSVGQTLGYAAMVQSAVATRADPKTGQITSTTRLHHIPCCPNGSVGHGVAVGHNRIWVALESP